VLQPVFYGERAAENGDDGVIEIVPEEGSLGPRRSALSKRLVDELAMQRRDVLSLHVASDPALALDLLVFTLADADTLDWRSPAATTIRGSYPSGPIAGFEPADASATAALADMRTSLDESWRAGTDVADRFDRFRTLPEEARAAWLGFVVGRTLEASLNMPGGRRVGFHDHLGRVLGIDIAQWWRPTAANYFDRVSKQVTLDALADVGGPELSARFASVKKADLASSAERVFSGAYFAEAEVQARALAWVPDVMRFGEALAEVMDAERSVADDEVPGELAA
jgi:ParB family chromosome partitioning protein